MKKEYLIIVLVVGLLNACQRQNKKDVIPEYDVINVDVNKVDILKYDDHFCSTKIIPLETTQESLIGKIEKLYITSDHILVFDSKMMNLLLFDTDGHFIRKIGMKGNGPGEYNFFNDIQFDKVESVVYAHERFQNCIYKYDLSGQLLEKTDRADVDFNSFFKTNDGYWVYSCFKKNNSNGYNLMLLDNDLKNIKKKFFPQKSFLNVSFSSTFMENEGGRAFYIYPSSNVIYELVNEDVVPFAEVNFGDKTMPYNLIVNMEDMEEYDNLVSDKKYLGDISDFKINDKYLYFSFNETGFNVSVSKYNCFYNYQSKETFIYKNPFIESMKYPVSTNILYASDSTLVYSMNLMVMTDGSFTFLSEELKTDIQFDSNPVLVIVNLNH